MNGMRPDWAMNLVLGRVTGVLHICIAQRPWKTSGGTGGSLFRSSLICWL
jgi:hypothetical protein